MAFVDDIKNEIEGLLTTQWNTRDGTVVPDASSVALANGAVKMKVTFLYADLAGSSNLAQNCPWETTAKILRAYLDTCTRLIRFHNGEVMSFDGDRVMGVFNSNTPNTDAIKCARKIDWVVNNVINPKAKVKFQSIQNHNIEIQHCVGVDCGEAVAVRAGIRNNNDLIWIGKAPSFAAKLSDIREFPYEVYISKASYDAIDGSKQLNGSGNCIWESRTYKGETVYRTLVALTP